MADAPPNQAEMQALLQKAREKRGKRLVKNLVLMTLTMVVIMIAMGVLGAYYLAMLVFVGLLPGLVAYVIDVRDKKLASKTVLAFNLAGFVPHFAGIANSGTIDQAALSTLRDPFSWLMIYGFALVGCGLIFLVPHINLLYLEVMADYKIKQLEAKQSELEDEWGYSVTGRAAATPEQDSAL